MKIFNVRYLINEIHCIKNFHLQSLVASYLKEYVPDYFWEIGASSTGKYHPSFSQGKGGLVRHTKAVVAFANELLRMSPYCNLTPDEQDAIIAACIIHDTCKYGIEDYNMRYIILDHISKPAYPYQRYLITPLGYLYSRR